MASTLDAMVDAMSRAAGQYYRLVLVVGPSGSGKTGVLQTLAREKGYPYLNVNLGLSQRLLELTRSQRARQVERLLKDMLNAAHGEVVLLDNLEILFDPALEIDPLRLLQVSSRNRTSVATWNGAFQNGTLTYAEPGHPEYQLFRQPDAVVVTVGQAGGSGPGGKSP